jgi:hypothetical protein
MMKKLADVHIRLQEMREQCLWPNGARHLWTDAFGVVLLTSLYRAVGDPKYLQQAEWVVAEVDRLLARPRGIRSDEAPDRPGQSYHQLAMWTYALGRLGEVDRRYRARAIDLAQDIHRSFVVPGVGVFGRMKDDLSGPLPGEGFGALDPFHGYVVYRMIDPAALQHEIAEMRSLIGVTWRTLSVTREQGLGLMLWLSHFFPREPWATTIRRRALTVLEEMWVDPPGYFCHEPGDRRHCVAFGNYAVSIGLQAIGAHSRRVERVNAFFETPRSSDPYADRAITAVLACASRFPGELITEGLASSTMTARASYR